MVAITASSPQVYLSEEAGNLVLRQGQSPNHTKNPHTKVLVIGGGVTGLTTAWALLDAGYSVIVASDRWACPDNPLTSQIAGALWEWPPAVCGMHTDPVSLDRSKRWCMISYHVFEKLHKLLPAETHGIRMRVSNFFFDSPIEEDAEEYAKMCEIEAAKIRGFQRDSTLIAKRAVNHSAGVIDAYRHEAPVLDTDVYMAWLRALVAAKGCQFVTQRISGDLRAIEDDLLDHYDAQVIVNCTGLGAYELAGDMTVYPLRGALIRLVNDGSRFPCVTEALIMAYDHAKQDEDGGIVFIVPRNDRVLILGGIAQPDEGELDLTLDSPEIRRMRNRCNQFVPGLDKAELDPDAPLVQGLRPLRAGNVRVERELSKKSDGSFSRVIHSYGHGGSGFTLSFGCAGEVLKLVRDVEACLPPIDGEF
ncbi:hypothetical protein NM688_g6490 [Phlebia brevispora]|uniref:Uncharacterized protein n=1 Tax=Phlebia brevispora TaxID=194682 RepID=A0ACC1SFH2_9APHY|nr:hypothetical protein NM688_g6490 [Phlebia brevispora]